MWHWLEQQDKAFTELKNMITNPPVLQYFDSSKPCTRLVDASSKGMGAALLQDKGPIAYALKFLTTSQQNYAQIEKEMLAIVFGCKKFHDYIHGSADVKIETDHKPRDYLIQASACSHSKTSKIDGVNTKISNHCTIQTTKRAIDC